MDTRVNVLVLSTVFHYRKIVVEKWWQRIIASFPGVPFSLPVNGTPPPKFLSGGTAYPTRIEYYFLSPPGIFYPRDTVSFRSQALQGPSFS